MILFPFMPINSKDRHVLAAAVVGKVEVLVTNNLKDFPAALLQPFGIKPMSPDDFLIDLFYFNREVMREVLIQQSEGLHNPTMTVTEILETLKQHTPNFVNLVQRES
jgi:hypothetical protein